MSDAKDTMIALNVLLKPSETSAHPKAANYTNTDFQDVIAGNWQ
jgi:hypothetical protein